MRGESRYMSPVSRVESSAASATVAVYTASVGVCRHCFQAPRPFPRRAADALLGCTAPRSVSVCLGVSCDLALGGRHATFCGSTCWARHPYLVGWDLRVPHSANGRTFVDRRVALLTASTRVAIVSCLSPVLESSRRHSSSSGLEKNALVLRRTSTSRPHHQRDRLASREPTLSSPLRAIRWDQVSEVHGCYNEVVGANTKDMKRKPKKKFTRAKQHGAG